MILVSLELCVVNTEEDDYPRMFAWYRLVRYWAVMRFDDTAAMPPGRLELGARGLRAVLEQTKTTGTDKRVQTLFGTIAWDAWVAAPGWLRAGFDLWAKHSFERDYFLALPAPDLNGLRRAEAEYKDSAAQGRRLFAKHLMAPIRTPAPGGDWGWKNSSSPLFVSRRAVQFWREHGDRAGLPSAAAALRAPREWIDSLGAWSAEGGETYVRVRRARVERMQAMVADTIRRGFEADDVLAEYETLDELARFLEAKGVPWEEVQEQVGLLTYFGPCPVGLHGSAIGNGTPGLAPNSPLPPIEWTCEGCPPTPAEARGQAAPATPASEGGRTAAVSPEQDVLHWPAEQTDDEMVEDVGAIPSGDSDATQARRRRRAWCRAHDFPDSNPDSPSESAEEPVEAGAPLAGDAEDLSEGDGFAALSEVDGSEAGAGATLQGGRERRPPPGLNPATIAEDVARLQALQEAKQEKREAEERVLPPRRLCASALLSGGAAGCYVVSITGHKRLRRLHLMGACFRVPGIHFGEFEVLGSEAPSPDLYDAICKSCWNDEEEVGEAEDSADEVSSLPSEE